MKRTYELINPELTVDALGDRPEDLDGDLWQVQASLAGQAGNRQQADVLLVVAAGGEGRAKEVAAKHLARWLSDTEEEQLLKEYGTLAEFGSCSMLAKRVAPAADPLRTRLREIAEGARSKADVLASRSPTATYVDPVQVLRALANEAERGLAPDPDKGLEIQRMLMVSTRHLPEEHRDWLLYQSRCLPAMPDMSLSSELDRSISTPGPYLIVDPIGDYGYRVCVDSEAAAQFLDNHNMEDPLVVLIRFAQTHRCDWLAIDRDGPVVDGLATYED